MLLKDCFSNWRCIFSVFKESTQVFFVRESLFSEPKHPYTCLLIESIPKIGLSKDQRLSTIEGNVPIPLNLKNECGFFSRCLKRIDGLCNRGIPELNKISEDHKVSCFLYDQKSSP